MNTNDELAAEASNFMGDILSLIKTGNVHEHLGLFRAACEQSFVSRVEPMLQRVRDEERAQAYGRDVREMLDNLGKGKAELEGAQNSKLDAVVEHLKRTADHSCDCMEGEDLAGFQKHEAVMLAAIDLLRTAGVEYNPITGNSKEVMKHDTERTLGKERTAASEVIPGAGASDDKHASVPRGWTPGPDAHELYVESAEEKAARRNE